MRIAINCQLLSMHRTGVGRYIRELVWALAHVDDENEYVLYANAQVPEGTFPSKGNFTVRLAQIPLLTAAARILWEQLCLPIALLQDQIDIVHFPDQSYPFLPLPCPSAITVHDLVFNIYPRTYTWGKRFYKNLAMKAAIDRADHIIVDSESTKRDVIQAYGISGERCSVIHCGLSEGFRPISDQSALDATRARFALPAKFILHVGTLAPDKNLASLIDAFVLLRQGFAVQHELVSVGPTGWLFNSLFRQVEEYGIQDEVHFLGYVGNDELARIYCLADILVFPSLYEGFGFPVLEAMACGTPVVTSNVSSLPEVAGEAALLVDPHHAPEIAEAIMTILKEEPVRNRLIARGFKRAQAFSWEQTAMRTLQVYSASANGT